MEHRQFFIKVIVFLMLFFVIDFFIDRAFNNLFNNVKSGTLFTSRYGWKTSEDQILILGASEVSHSYIPELISKGLGKSCYNLGMDGHNVYYQYALLESVLTRYKPEYILISPHIIEESTKSIGGLYPYYKDTIAKNVIFDVDKSMRYKGRIKAYLYNSLIIKLIQANVTAKSERCGYMPIYSKNRFLKLDTVKYGFGSSERTLNYFDKILRLSNNPETEVIIVDVPKYQYSLGSRELEDIKLIASNRDAGFISFMNDTTFLNNPKYFKDRTHLNDDGARVFTTMIIDTLKQYINESKRTAERSNNSQL